MKKTLRKQIAMAVGVLGVAACDAPSPPETAISQPVEIPEAEVSQPVEIPEAEVSRPVDPAVIAAAEAIAEVLRDEDPYARARRLGELLPTLGPEGVPGAKEALRDPKLLLYRGGAETELLARFWATHEPEEATRWAVDEAPSGYRLSAVFATLSRWAAVDPRSAAVAVQGWESNRDDVRELVHVALVYGWFEKDPVELARHIQQQEMGIGRQRMLSNYIRLLIHHQGVEAAVRWAESVPENDVLYKVNVYRQMGSALPIFDIAAALRWCEAHCAGPNGRGIRLAIANRWAHLDEGSAAVEWLLSQPEVRTEALWDAFRTWAGRHPKQAAAWMKAGIRAADGAPEPRVRRLSAAYAELLIPESPAEAIEWAERIEDEGERERMLIRIARAWRWQDEAVAEAWLRESPLSEEDRERARQGPPPLYDQPKK